MTTRNSTTDSATSPKLYVGTYAKYNSGSIAGAWLDLADYADREDFLAACAELHKDEADPEFMMQDHENLPGSLYSESYPHPLIWEWLAMDKHDREAVALYMEHVDDDIERALERAVASYRGLFDSPADFAERWHDEIGDLEDLPQFWHSHIDWESVAYDMDCENFNFCHTWDTGKYSGARYELMSRGPCHVFESR